MLKLQIFDQSELGICDLELIVYERGFGECEIFLVVGSVVRII